MKKMVSQHTPDILKDKQEKNNRTCLIRQPHCLNIKNSRDIRRKFNKLFPGMLIRNCRTTAGGSILIELNDTDAASKVMEAWHTNYFHGNKGIVKAGLHNADGFIKYVDEVYSEEEIKDSVAKQYPGATADLFFRGNEKRFTGSVKIQFSNIHQMEDALANKIKIGHHVSYVEKFVHKPRVVKCNRCQKFGHISCLCQSAKPTCAKCGLNEHS